MSPEGRRARVPPADVHAWLAVAFALYALVAVLQPDACDPERD